MNVGVRAFIGFGNDQSNQTVDFTRVAVGLRGAHGIDISHETVRYWWNRFSPLFAGDIRRQRVSPRRMRPRRSSGWNTTAMTKAGYIK